MSLNNTAEQLSAVDQAREINYELRYKTDTATWLAETLYGSMRTSFYYDHDPMNGLLSEDGGKLEDIFDDAIKEARLITEENPGLLFELRRRLTEREELDDMEALAQSALLTEEGAQANTIIVVSDFPSELMDASEDVGGYNSARKQTMLRVITKEPDGRLRVTSRSLDGSNRQALEAIYHRFGLQPQEGELLGQRITLNIPPVWQGQIVGNLTDAYDQSLSEQFGGHWHAGMRLPNERAHINTYEFSKAQTDLIDWFSNIRLRDPHRAEQLRYNVAATAKARFERFLQSKGTELMPVADHVQASTLINLNYVRQAFYRDMERELYREGRRAAIRGDVFSGCGATVIAEDEQRGSTQLSLLGYGNRSTLDANGKCTYPVKECPECHKKDVLATETDKEISGSCGCVVKKK